MAIQLSEEEKEDYLRRVLRSYKETRNSFHCGHIKLDSLKLWVFLDNVPLPYSHRFVGICERLHHHHWVTHSVDEGYSNISEFMKDCFPDLCSRFPATPNNYKWPPNDLDSRITFLETYIRDAYGH